MVCYRGGERQDWKKGKIREIEQQTHGTVLQTCTQPECPSHIYIYFVVLETIRLSMWSFLDFIHFFLKNSSQNLQEVIFKNLSLTG